MIRGRRILVAIPTPFMADRGTPIAVNQVIRVLSEGENNVDVLAFPMGEDLELPGLRTFRVPNLLGLRHVPVGFSLRKLFLDFFMAFEMRKRIKYGDYDCIHAVEETAFVAVILGRRFGIPVVYDMQSCLPEQMAKASFFRLRPIQALLRRAERWLLNNADVIVCSLGLLDYVRSIEPLASLEWCFPGQHPEVGKDDVALLRSGLGIHENAKVVLYSGTFETYQGLEELIDAAPAVVAEHPETVFVLVGAGDEPVKLPAEARRLELSGNLQILKRQPRHMMPRFLHMADVVVSPRSFGDNLPLKIFDYMAAGRPIVATDIATHRQVLDDSRAELVAPSSSALATGISRLLGDEGHARRLGEAAQAYSDRYLGWRKFKENVADVFAQAIS